ncbi:tetratricopeptide repeat protein [Streptomyces sp. MMG1121]|uniref:tetratricopeptide repeat protein n=1 Tax=Streptomyces sp. MMG1121 TaxID=1415544 RepID=UPI0006ADA0D8|nr:tetratricopeptide repeat protein [Streptomyces sp. MMG1121]KOV59147.1 hypothetical protein ADK64_33770 [Streptomyces sp. MMG1121]
MDNLLTVPGTAPLSAAPPPRRARRWPRRVLLTALAGGVVAGAVLTLLPAEAGKRVVRAPAAGPQAPAGARTALTALASGAPAALPQLAALIGQQEQRVRLRPRDARAWAVLGGAYVERGRRTADPADYPRAERALWTSLRVRAAKNAEAFEGLTALALARRDFGAAEGYGERALEESPKRWTAYPPLIDAYTGLGDYKAARASLDKLLELRTGAAARPAVMARAAAVYRDQGWREDAVAQLTDAAAAAGTPVQRAALLAGLGQLAWERGDLPDALRHCEAALRLDPGQQAALTGRGRTLAALGRTAEAFTAYRAALAGRPDPQDAYELGELYEANGMAREAAAQYARAEVLVRRRVAAGVDEELLVGQFEADHGNAPDAVGRLRAEWRRQPGTEVADALGWALHRTGDDAEALPYAAAATDRSKGGGVLNALYAYHRGVIEQGRQLYAPARRHLQEALRTNPYFSPLGVPAAQAALRALGDVPVGPAPS